MGRPVLLLLGVLLLLAACAQQEPPATQLEPNGESPALTTQAETGGVFFSEYIEGSSNNKALEIYNATGSDIDLGASGYAVRMYFNGSASAGLTINLAGTLAAGDVYVLAHASAVDAILAQADLINSSGWFNGDDAVALERNGTVLDVIGQIGFDPGSQWGSGLASTADNTLRRKANVCAGDPDGSDAFDPSLEWDGFATDTFDGLGQHTVAECAPGDGGDGGDDGDGDGDHDAEQCGAEATMIHAVQGAGATTPMAGRVVTIEGVVVGDFQRDDGDEYGTDIGGFHVQEEDDQADGDPATSEGIYVYHWDTDVSVGDLVRVTGTVGEFNGLTQLSIVTNVVVCDTDVALPTPAVIEFPLESIAALEAYEGMLVTFPQELVISEYFNYDRFGEIVLSWPAEGAARVQQPTAIYDVDDPAIDAYVDLMSRSRITLDDGIGSQNPAIVRHPDGTLFTTTHTFRGGDRLKDLTGVLDYSFGIYRVQPVLGAEHIEANPRPLTPEDVGGTVRAAAFNVLNYFVTLGSRGADDAEEFERQRDKIIAALALMDAQVVGLIEIENSDDQAALIDLVAGLNAVAGAGTYAHVDTQGPVGTDEIKVALIYQPAALTPVGAHAILDSPEFLDPNDTGADRNRAALAQTFEENASGGRFTIVVNHFKSKGSSCGEAGESDLVGSCDVTRTLAAKALLEWLATDPTGAGDPDYLLVGDFNAYDHEAPIYALRAGADGEPGTSDDYTDLLREFQGEEAYTYVFDGTVGYLDYALASRALLPQVTGVTAWHINADEPDVLDYDTSFKSDEQAALYEPTPFRSSDHDPVIVGLELTAALECGEATLDIGSLWPANQQLVSGQLRVSDVDGNPLSVTVDSVYQDEPVVGSGSGSSSPDAVIHEGGAVELRAEREGGGNGRVYHVAYTATDERGSCSGVVTLGVPTSQGRNGQAVDDGPLYDSTLP